MQIKIQTIKSQNAKNIVVFSTEYGTAKALWNGDAPKNDKEYDVEVTIHETLEWGKDIVMVGEKRYVIGMICGVFYLIGYLESVDEDGGFAIRFGDSIILVSGCGNPFALGTFVKVEAHDVELYDTHYI